MIKTLHIHNFQSHKDSTLELSPGVNLIIGQSDSGKTAIIRAIKWLATNRPLGDGFVSWNKKGVTEVEVFLDDGSQLIHRPGRYVFNKGLDQQEWSAIGSVVPETVVQTLNISELSWQMQMDAPFLLSDSSGEVARILNEVADLNKIDSTQANINRMARDNRSQLTECANRKQQVEQDLSTFQNLDNQLARIAQLKERDRKAGILEDLVTAGDRLVISITNQEEALTHYSDVTKQLEQVQQLQRSVTLETRINNEIGLGQEKLDELKELTTRLDGIKDLSDAEEELDLLLDLVGQAKKLDKDMDDMVRQIAVVAKKKSLLVELTENLKQLEDQWKEQFPGVCPLCGRTDS